MLSDMSLSDSVVRNTSFIQPTKGVEDVQGNEVVKYDIHWSKQSTTSMEPSMLSFFRKGRLISLSISLTGSEETPLRSLLRFKRRHGASSDDGYHETNRLQIPSDWRRVSQALPAQEKPRPQWHLLHNSRDWFLQLGASRTARKVQR